MLSSDARAVDLSVRASASTQACDAARRGDSARRAYSVSRPGPVPPLELAAGFLRELAFQSGARGARRVCWRWLIIRLPHDCMFGTQVRESVWRRSSSPALAPCELVQRRCSLFGPSVPRRAAASLAMLLLLRLSKGEAVSLRCMADSPGCGLLSRSARLRRRSFLPFAQESRLLSQCLVDAGSHRPGTAAVKAWLESAPSRLPRQNGPPSWTNLQARC